MFPNCPVCGFAEMPYAPVRYNVCPCCGTEFSVDDRKVSHPALTQSWVNAGMPWFDDITLPTRNWNPYRQLIKAGLTAGFVRIDATGVQNRQSDIVLPVFAQLQ